MSRDENVAIFEDTRRFCKSVLPSLPKSALYGLNNRRMAFWGANVLAMVINSMV